MNKAGFFAKSVSSLVVAVIIITAFTKEPVKIWLLAASLIVWFIYVIAKAVIRSKTRKTRSNERLTSIVGEPIDFSSDFEAATASTLLLCHVNHRITSHLKSAYPDVMWDWEMEDPEQFVMNGGAARIKLHGVEDFTHAEVAIDNTNAQITCDLFRFERIDNRVSAPNTGDAGEWFRAYGQKMLAHIVGDLRSRGYDELTINDEGNILIGMPYGYAKVNALRNFPGRQHWDQLCELFENAGYIISESDGGVCLSWAEERVAV